MNFYDFKYDLINTYMSYLFYSLARPLCLILSCLMPDIESAAFEEERAEEAVDPSMEWEWQPNEII